MNTRLTNTLLAVVGALTLANATMMMADGPGAGRGLQLYGFLDASEVQNELRVAADGYGTEFGGTGGEFLPWVGDPVTGAAKVRTASSLLEYRFCDLSEIPNPVAGMVATIDAAQNVVQIPMPEIGGKGGVPLPTGLPTAAPGTPGTFWGLSTLKNEAKGVQLEVSMVHTSPDTLYLRPGGNAAFPGNGIPWEAGEIVTFPSGSTIGMGGVSRQGGIRWWVY